jgi:hypothetical protein
MFVYNLTSMLLIFKKKHKSWTVHMTINLLGILSWTKLIETMPLSLVPN